MTDSMDVDENESEATKNVKEHDSETSPKMSAKKVRLFSAKVFREKLKTPESDNALKEFLGLCNGDHKQDCVLEYLEKGGSCMELLNVLETGSSAPYIVLEVVNCVLLRISANFMQYHSVTCDACRYFLNTYITLINKLLALSSTTRDRRVILKLLTAIVTFSSSSAKDILLHVNFNPTILELCTKQTEERDCVRNAFVHFLTAFLVDGFYPTISVLLEKKGLLVSVMNGLQYDTADTICMFITTLKTSILQNPSVSKTAKMKLFNTHVVRDIVNLYNWKGPRSFNKKKSENRPPVNDIEKSKVNESVHDFLLILCTSHRFGVIFKDRSLGMGKKQQNSLMFTVLEGLERPWDHSYACDLVTKICGACPDLSKSMWSSLKPYLEPRATVHWLNALKFAHVLLEELQPVSIEFCIKDLTITQLAQAIQFLVVPTPILKVVLPENFTALESMVKYNILRFLKTTLISVRDYLNTIKNWMPTEKLRHLRGIMSEHIFRNFPNPQILLENWHHVDENSELKSNDSLDNLSLIFDVLGLYEEVCPQLLEGLINTTDLMGLFKTIDEHCDDNENDKKLRLLIKATNLFLVLDLNAFVPSQNLFASVIPLLFEFYYKSKEEAARTTLTKLFKLTGVFEGSEIEIDAWINAIFALKSFDVEVPNYLVNVLKATSANIFEYLEKMSEIRANTSDNITSGVDFEDILEALLVDKEQRTMKIKHVNLSPFVLGVLQTDSTHGKHVKTFLNTAFLNVFHLQTCPGFFMQILSNSDNAASKTVISRKVLSYILSWEQPGVEVLEGTKVLALETISSIILTQDANANFVKALDAVIVHPGLKLNLLRMCVFYVTNLASLQSLGEHNLRKTLELTKHLIKTSGNDDLVYLSAVLAHPVLLQYFDVYHKSSSDNKALCTSFVIELVKEYRDRNLENLLLDFKEKIHSSIVKLLRKPKRYKAKCDKLVEALEAIGLNLEQSRNILFLMRDMDHIVFVNDDNHLSVVYYVTLYVLQRFSDMCKKNRRLPLLSMESVTTLDAVLSFLNSKELDTSQLASTICSYFKDFPHSLQYTSTDLFVSILNRKEYCKENSLLAALLLRSSDRYMELFTKNIQSISFTKGLILPLLEATIAQNAEAEVLQKIYASFEPTIEKALQKPQKAGPHFEKYYQGVVSLIKQFMPLEKCKFYVDKIHKFETTEIFHVSMLRAIFDKLDLNEKQLNNVILTFVHLGMSLFKKKTKTGADWAKITEVAYLVDGYLQTVIEKCKESSFTHVCENETFKLYMKFYLKFGLAGNPALLKLITSFCAFLNLDKDYVSLLLDMMLSHSEFLEVTLNDNKPCKEEILSMFLVLCQRWPAIMQRSHVPLLLSAYRATWSTCDKIILSLIKLYEVYAGQTYFYDFKPFLWSHAAANYYSVRSDVQKALWRQPKMGDVVDILQESWIMNTHTKHPLQPSQNLPGDVSSSNVYDFAFILPLFSALLAPENSVQTYRFSRSGALSLTISALSSDAEEVRSAACYVLFRFYNHLEAKQGGKDKVVWLRFVEAICKGVSVLPNCKLNHFSGLFLSRMAMILTQPTHVMYVPLSQYLGAKSTPDFNSIPELYTFLHSCDVNFKEHRIFILEVLRDGLRTGQDLKVAQRSMAFKLILELYNSSVADSDTKALILQILSNTCSIPKGSKYLCNIFGLLSFLYNVVSNLPSDLRLLSPVIGIINKVMKNADDVDLNIVEAILGRVVDEFCDSFKDDELPLLLEAILVLCDKGSDFLSESRIKKIVASTKSSDAEYLLQYGSANLAQFYADDKKDKEHFVKLLVLRRFQKNGT